MDWSNGDDKHTEETAIEQSQFPNREWIDANGMAICHSSSQLAPCAVPQLESDVPGWPLIGSGGGAWPKFAEIIFDIMF